MILSVDATHLLMASEDSDVVGMKAVPQTPQGPRAMHGGAVATGHTPTPSHSRTIFRAGGGGGGGGGGLGLGGGREAAKKGGGGFIA